MITRGDSGFVRTVLPLLLYDAALWSVEVVVVDVAESYEVLRDRAGWDIGVAIGCFSAAGTAGSEDAFSDDFSWKLNRLLVPVDAGLIIAGDMFLRKSR